MMRVIYFEGYAGKNTVVVRSAGLDFNRASRNKTLAYGHHTSRLYRAALRLHGFMIATTAALTRESAAALTADGFRLHNVGAHPSHNRHLSQSAA